MKGRWHYLLFGGGLALVLMAAVACAGTEGPAGPTGPQGPAGPTGPKGEKGGFDAPAPAVKQFHLNVIEIKGTTNTDDLAPPTVDPETLSDGYGFKAPGFDPANPKNWRVESYMWTPAAMTVFEGDTVELTTFVLNGNKHEVWAEAPDGEEVVQEFEMNRGREYNISFTASQAGVYRLICNTHEPTMTAYILALPTS